MNEKLTFISTFKDLIPKYIEYKQSLGFTYDYDYAKRLRGMDRFFHENYALSQIILTKKMVLDFVKKEIMKLILQSVYVVLLFVVLLLF